MTRSNFSVYFYQIFILGQARKITGDAYLLLLLLVVLSVDVFDKGSCKKKNFCDFPNICWKFFLGRNSFQSVLTLVLMECFFLVGGGDIMCTLHFDWTNLQHYCFFGNILCIQNYSHQLERMKICCIFSSGFGYTERIMDKGTRKKTFFF